MNEFTGMRPSAVNAQAISCQKAPRASEWPHVADRTGRRRAAARQGGPAAQVPRRRRKRPERADGQYLISVGN